MTCRQVRDVKRALEATGLEWELKSAGRHDMVFLAGKWLGAISHAVKAHDARNVLDAIQRHAKRVKKGLA